MLEIKGHGPCLNLETAANLAKINLTTLRPRLAPVMHLLPQNVQGCHVNSKFIHWEAVLELMKIEQNGSWSQDKDEFFEMVRLCHEPKPEHPQGALVATPDPVITESLGKIDEALHEEALVLAKKALTLTAFGLSVEDALAAVEKLNKVG